jgi:heavy metal translocating P-type ATPase
MPAPTVENVSIVNHIVTVLHKRDVKAATMTTMLTNAGYEVFDVVFDPTSTESRRSSDSSFIKGEQLDAAVRRWEPSRQSSVDTLVRSRHGHHCQMCAALGTDEGHPDSLESVTVIDSVASLPRYQLTLSIDGMTCSSCVGHVTSAVENVPDVISVNVALVSHSAEITFSTSDKDNLVKTLITAVEDAGYDAETIDIKAIADVSHHTEPSDEAEGSWEATYSIDGMTCSSCSNKVTEVIKELPFVVSVNINLISHSGTVVFTGKKNESLLLETIDNTGYEATLTELKPLAQAESAAERTISLQVLGMHCEQCPSRILEALKQLPVEVTKAPTLQKPVVSVSYVPDAPRLTIRHIIDTVINIDNSFDVTIYKPKSVEQRSREMLAKERRAIAIRALMSIITAIPTLIIGVIYMNLVAEDDPGYKFIMQPVHGVSLAEWATFALSTPIYLFAADHFHRRTLKEIWALWRPRSPVPIGKRFYRFGSMNMLISLGTTIAYFSSLAQLIVAASNPAEDLLSSSKQSYFDSVVFLTMFLLIGRLAEAHMKAKSGDAISALGQLRPTEAILQKRDDSGEITNEKISAELIDSGDHVKVLQGSSPPCDGTLIGDEASFDESSLTGEARIVKKKEGDAIFTGTINKGSSIVIRVTKPAGASMLDSIIQVVREGQSKRAPMERIADLLTAYFVPVVVAIAIVTWIVWLSLGLSGVLPRNYLDNDIGGWPFWSLQFAIAVFVIACPCGLGLAAPTALFVGGGMAAKRGILVKGGGEAFQEASNLDAVVFDKTGTLTEGVEPKVVEHSIYVDDAGLDAATICGVIKGVEENSGHPLARAAIAFCKSQSPSAVTITSTDEIAGKGMKASFILKSSKSSTHYQALVGNEGLMHDHGVPIPQGASDLMETWKSSGYSVIVMAYDDDHQWRVGAVLGAADPLRPEAAGVVKSLRARGVEVWMLSGDNVSTARAVAKQVGIHADNVIAGVLPAEKADKVRYLQRALRPRRGRGFHSRLTNKRSRATVAMVGDGINDAPALAAADVGIAVASGSDVAIQSAAFILVHSDLRAVLTLVTLSRAVFRRVILNMFWAAIYNIVALPIAAGVLYPITTSGGTHLRLDPAWAALAMALSSLTVVASSLLLRTKIPIGGFRELSWS